MSEGYQEALRQRAERIERLRAWCTEHLGGASRRVLEIGCGHGHFLTAYAVANPEQACTGIDLVTKRIEKGNAKAEKRDLAQLRFLKAELGEFLEALPEGMLFERVFMLFPDPWPKKRHFKNRMIQASFLERLAEITTPDADFCYRTDHEGYFAWTVEHIQASAQWTIKQEAEWPLEERSFFQDMMESWQSLIAVKA
ncbi:tRNA (guanine(46)-N(7))-methyltransferase TrmB [Cerasicoccus maritimus]|uniref:tRNA (guanine(46)-N(7))-methyltransferase TrmB n=1 Tax=Cerasicoccus maritimus TaxID=490089 RepID=UPI0028527BC0|nr:methyltransferase domain-containing protein [Cerasicoccus maritimus]